MSLSPHARDLQYAAVVNAAAYVGLTASQGEPRRNQGYERQRISLTQDGTAPDELKFGPFQSDMTTDLAEYVIYDTDGQELGREALMPPRKPLRGDVIILPAGAVRLQRSE